jgi:hypothetical protein
MVQMNPIKLKYQSLQQLPNQVQVESYQRRMLNIAIPRVTGVFP